MLDQVDHTGSHTQGHHLHFRVFTLFIGLCMVVLCVQSTFTEPSWSPPPYQWLEGRGLIHGKRHCWSVCLSVSLSEFHLLPSVQCEDTPRSSPSTCCIANRYHGLCCSSTPSGCFPATFTSLTYSVGHLLTCLNFETHENKYVPSTKQL